MCARWHRGYAYQGNGGMWQGFDKTLILYVTK